MDIKKPAKKVLYYLQKNPISRLLYKKEVVKRSQLPFADILPLSRHINMFSPFTSEIHPPNDWYGHAKIFKKFLGLLENYSFKFIIEHGTYLNNEVAPAELETKLPTFITYSNRRIKILKRYGDYAFSIGPFISYASDLLSAKELAGEKERIGKCLLVFPMHSCLDRDFIFNAYEFCKLIKKLGKNFNTIRVCLYWVDVLKGKYKPYQDFGFECVTAGHILDPLFLPRLKSMIKTSDLTVSNDISTQIPYCISLKKPHCVIPQKHYISGNKNQIIEDASLTNSKPYKVLLKTFSKLESKITQKQLELVNFYWGLNQTKTKKQFLDIVSRSEEIYLRRLNKYE